jgi:hypothetical protein
MYATAAVAPTPQATAVSRSRVEMSLGPTLSNPIWEPCSLRRSIKQNQASLFQQLSYSLRYALPSYIGLYIASHTWRLRRRILRADGQSTLLCGRPPRNEVPVANTCPEGILRQDNGSRGKCAGGVKSRCSIPSFLRFLQSICHAVLCL